MSEIVAYRYRYKDALTWVHSTTEPARHPNLIVEPLCVADEVKALEAQLDQASGVIADRNARISELEEALADVSNPLGYLKRYAEKQGSELNGSAHSIENDLGFVQRIARAALEGRS